MNAMSMNAEVKTKGDPRVKELIWFNVSVMYSGFCAALAIEAPPGGRWRGWLVFLAVHGALWAVYRAIAAHSGASTNETT